MFVITTDQRDSRHDDDRVDAMIRRLSDRYATDLSLPPERTAGDEFQLLLRQPSAALDAILFLHREAHWSIGLGIGSVEHPLPDSVRAARGPAFFAARRAVESAKNRPSRFAVDPVGAAVTFPTPLDFEALADPYLLHRDQRSAAGWQVADLVELGSSQSEIADRLAVTPQAISSRARAANVRMDAPARVALERLLDAIDHLHEGNPE